MEINGLEFCPTVWVLGVTNQNLQYLLPTLSCSSTKWGKTLAHIIAMSTASRCSESDLEWDPSDETSTLNLQQKYPEKTWAAIWR